MADKPREKESEKKPSNQEALRDLIAHVARTKEGRLFLSYLHRDCGFIDTDSRWDPNTGDINAMAIVHNAAQRNVYVRIRKYIPRDCILEIEN